MMAVFSRQEYVARIARAEAAMREAGLDALIAYSVGNNPGAVGYLGGYEPRMGMGDVAYFVVLPGARPSYVLLANGFWDRPEEITWTADTLITSDFGNRLAELVGSAMNRVGIAGYAFFPAPVLQILQAAHPAVHFEDATELLKGVAQIKSLPELEIIRRAAEISDAGARAFLSNVRAGMHERVLQSVVDRAMLESGADGFAFPTFIMDGPKVPVSIGFAEDRELEPGEQVNVLCGAQYRGYRVEVGRVTCVGEPSREAYKIMEAAAEMYEAMLATTRAGAPVGEVAAASVSVAARHGMADYLYKSINNKATQGHGMGCWVSEPPPIYPGETSLLQPNMALSLEARLGIPGVGGAVITEMVIVTPEGAERLSKLDLRTWTRPFLSS
jgi:Xaa-Pro aminopeptidase